MFSNIINWFRTKIHPRPVAASSNQPIIIPRAGHNVSRADLSRNALKVLNRLSGHGFETYLVGGGVRDILLGRCPKDFDIATNATPEQVRALFRNCRLIGRRFRLAHIFFGQDIIEVATFRASQTDDEPDSTAKQSDEGMILRDNVFGTLEEDVFRRDFTVNALYYNIADFSIVDYVGGLKDVEKRVLRLIGEPNRRYREDPVRMLRAIRFAAKLNFEIHPSCYEPILELNHLLTHVPAARLFDEYLKMFLSGTSHAAFELLLKTDIFSKLFPQTNSFLVKEHMPYVGKFIQAALESTDLRISEGKTVTPSFLIAAFLWYPVSKQLQQEMKSGKTEQLALDDVSDRVLAKQQKIMSIPRRFSTGAREIWSLQFRLARRGGRRAEMIFNQPKFRAAYDFMLLRAEVGDKEAQVLAEWWTEYMHSDEEQRWAMASSIREGKKKRRRPKRQKPKQSQGGSH